MTTANTFLASGCSISLCLLLAGCGGGDSSSSASPTVSEPSKRAVSGTVPGTLIEAFCQDGGYYSVTSTDDGTAKHPFYLELPSDANCKLIMTTNEKDPDVTKHIVTPILFNNGSTVSSYIQVVDNTDLGYIPLPMSGVGVQTPLIVEVTNAHAITVNTITDDPLDKDHDDIPNAYEDDDGDGIYNKYDDDNDDYSKDDDDDKDDYSKDDDDDDKDDYSKDDDDDDKDDYSKDDDDDKDDYSKDDDDDKDDYSKDDDDNTYNNTFTTPTVALPTGYTPNAGRLLGAQCAQCHGTNGISVNKWDSIAGEDNLHKEMFEDDAPIMMAQARGYTRDEITLLENWFQSLTKYKD